MHEEPFSHEHRAADSGIAREIECVTYLRRKYIHFHTFFFLRKRMRSGLIQIHLVRPNGVILQIFHATGCILLPLSLCVCIAFRLVLLDWRRLHGATLVDVHLGDLIQVIEIVLPKYQTQPDPISFRPSAACSMLSRTTHLAHLVHRVGEHGSSERREASSEKQVLHAQRESHFAVSACSTTFL